MRASCALLGSSLSVHHCSRLTLSHSHLACPPPSATDKRSMDASQNNSVMDVELSHSQPPSTEAPGADANNHCEILPRHSFIDACPIQGPPYRAPPTGPPLWFPRPMAPLMGALRRGRPLEGEPRGRSPEAALAEAPGCLARRLLALVWLDFLRL